MAEGAKLAVSQFDQRNPDQVATLPARHARC